MTDYQKELIKEHKELCARIILFEPTVTENMCKDSVELVNRAIQRKAMEDYERALAARLCNSGIVIDGSLICPIYSEVITEEQLTSSTTPVEEMPTTEDKVGSDYDKDTISGVAGISETTGENDNCK